MWLAWKKKSGRDKKAPLHLDVTLFCVAVQLVLLAVQHDCIGDWCDTGQIAATLICCRVPVTYARYFSCFLSPIDLLLPAHTCCTKLSRIGILIVVALSKKVSSENLREVATTSHQIVSGSVF